MMPTLIANHMVQNTGLQMATAATWCLSRGFASAFTWSPSEIVQTKDSTFFSCTMTSDASKARTTRYAAPSFYRGFAVNAASNPDPTSDSKSKVPQSAKDETVRTLGAPGHGASYASGYVAPHPSMNPGKLSVPQAVSADDLQESYMGAPQSSYYDTKYLESIRPTHLPPKDLADRVGFKAVQIMRNGFDITTGYGPNMTEEKWLRRMIFLETVAGVPGMVAGMLRHLESLRVMRRDKGWIHCLLEEAENERMHLLTFLELRKPGPLFRAMVLLTQGIVFNAYFLVYLVWPKVCHSFVGYLEEEAVRTYTHCLEDIDSGKVWKDAPAPAIAKTYWRLKPDANMRDLILAVRADEACHSHVNHTLKNVKADAPNPFAHGESQLP